MNIFDLGSTIIRKFDALLQAISLLPKKGETNPISFPTGTNSISAQPLLASGTTQAGVLSCTFYLVGNAATLTIDGQTYTNPSNTGSASTFHFQADVGKTLNGKTYSVGNSGTGIIYYVS